MIKKIGQHIIIGMMFALVFAFPTTIFAHTQLEMSSPKEGETVTTELKDVSLQFDTNIEKLSSFKIIHESKQEVPLDQTTIEGNTMTRHIMDGTALENGTYTIEWRIVGKDGHPIEGKYDFIVNIKAKEPVTETNEKEPEIADKEAVSEPKETPEVTSETASSNQANTESDINQTGKSNIWIYFVVGIMIILIIAGVGRVITRRKK
ncbi:hypothetical protein AK95_25620 [Paenibacillus sp. LC231]|jgi:methionine-rich copper-binding protein CopC|uniref:CopC domain-containing protein n=1 Tax=Paenibacillus lautus TaxID=1401 RepID=A0A385TWL2_PAELA|nr:MULTISPECIES: copper resistance CopC family protein [Paenibacillus]AYB48166.1 hypothetical protein D5F53_33160 [Paenibacillus lautus]MBX4152497.1 copper resistance protein CopC [Paenibacillus lautus]OIB00558.1 hypothetical protein AK95_25620 [Paenibacillus sp. LC231]VTR35858.1 Copper resistance protein CopC [Actinobacillus pleuropneumoniae]